tara:strand:+ start:723 stop:974 length:252 start_codon:yes stop_codon:yes gene_type:complete
MKKLSTCLALAAFIGAASLASPADAFSFSKLLSDGLKKGKDFVKKQVNDPDNQKMALGLAKTAGGMALDAGKSYASSKLSGSK